MSRKTEIADMSGSDSGNVYRGASPKTALAESPKTKLAWPGQAGEETGAAQPPVDDLPPVVGWLVVIDGPGKGRSREITFGLNTIGRDEGNAITLDFGDKEISGANHFRIAYDALNRMFLISAGDGRNLVYVARKPLIDAQELVSGTDIKVGATTLRFVALCGADWSWTPADAS